MTSGSDLERILVQLSQDAADEDAWVELYRRLWPLVFAITFRKLRGARALAEDAAQDVFFGLARTQPFSRLSDAGALRAYVRRSAENTATNYLKHLLRSRETVVDELDGVPPVTRSHDVSADVEFREWIELLGQPLPEIDRAILTHVIEDRGLSEIAEKTGLSYGNVGVRLHRLRIRLRKVLESKGVVADVPDRAKKPSS